MDFNLSEEHKIFRQAVRGFVEKEIGPLVEQAEEKEEFPVELMTKMGRLGYLCPGYPIEYGGGSMGRTGECILIEELGKVSIGIATGIDVQFGLGTAAILTYGNDEQKEKYLIPAIKGEKIAAFGLTEPNAGSDAAAIETTAKRDGNFYVLNGSKMFISNAPICDFVTLVVYTDKSKGPRGGISLIIVDKGMPGFEVKKLRKMCTHPAETGELSFTDCRVPVSNLVGEEGKGMSYVRETLAAGRIINAARCLGGAQRVLDESIKYARERVQFGQPIGQFQAVSFKLARMATEIEAARWMTYHAAWMDDQGQPCLKEAVMSKFFASEMLKKATDEAMQIHGGYAFMMDSPIQRFYRDARLSVITTGTSEIQQIIIARQIGLRW